MMLTTEELWRDYRDRIFRFFAARVKNDALSEDLTQEVFVRIHRNLHTLKNQAALAGWVFQIVRNVLADHYRQSISFSPLPPELPDERDEAAETTRAARESLENCLMPLIDALEEPYQNAVRLADLEGVSQQELATRERLTLAGAKSRVQRGRAKLRHLLEQCCEFETDRQGNVEGFRVRDPKSSCCVHPFETSCVLRKNHSKGVSMNSPKVSAHPQGVIVRFGTESKRSEIEAMVESCRNGTCGCQMPVKPESIEVTGEDGSVAVVVSGQNLDPAKFQEAVNTCGCGG